MSCAEFTSSRSRTSSWCPAVIRAGITDYLQFVIKAAKPYAPVAQRLAAAIRSSRTSDVVDLCSGAGGPWLTLVDAVETSKWTTEGDAHRSLA
jgi:hypothetical protein